MKKLSNIDFDLVEADFIRIFEVCLVVAIIFLVLFFGLANFIAGTPEPEFWLKIEGLLGITW